MLYGQASKKVWSEPQSITNGASVTLVIDRLGFDYAEIDIALGHVSATNLPPTTLALAESDITGSTNFVNLTGGTSQVISTANFSTLSPSVSLTTGSQLVNANVDCRNRKRYLQATVTAATTQVVSVIANLSRGKQEVASDGDSAATVRVSG